MLLSFDGNMTTTNKKLLNFKEYMQHMRIARGLAQFWWLYFLLVFFKFSLRSYFFSYLINQHRFKSSLGSAETIHLHHESNFFKKNNFIFYETPKLIITLTLCTEMWNEHCSEWKFYMFSGLGLGLSILSLFKTSFLMNYYETKSTFQYWINICYANTERRHFPWSYAKRLTA